MDTVVNYKEVQFLDYSTLPDEDARELFNLLHPEVHYGENELPWREFASISLECSSPKKSSVANISSNCSIDLQQSNSGRHEVFPEALPISTPQTFTAGPSLDMPTKAQIPPAPFLATGPPRTLPPHTLSQYPQQPPITFFSRPPFPVVTSAYPMHGQEMLTLHHQQAANYSDPALYDLPPPDSDQQAAMDHQHHQKYRVDKQATYPFKKQKKPFYEHVYSHDDVMQSMMDGSMDSINSQPALAAPVVPFSNFTTGISGPTGYPVQYFPSYVPYMQYTSYMQQPGTLVDMPQAGPDVIPFEPPLVVPSHPPPVLPTVPPAVSSQVPVTCVSVSEIPQQQEQEMNTEVHASSSDVPVEKDLISSENRLWVADSASAPSEPLTEPEKVESQDDKAVPSVEPVEEGVVGVEPQTEDSPLEECSPVKHTSESTPTPVPENEPTAKAELSPKSSSSPAVTSVWGSGKSWAGLFKTEGVPVPEPLPSKALEALDCHSPEEEAVSSDGEVDCLLYKLGKFVQQLKLDFTIRPFQPRGLINRSNWCYINATLQALLVCPALYNMLRQFQEIVCQRNKSSTPILDSLVELISEFTPLNNVSKRKEDLSIGPALEPVCIHKMLTLIKSECVKGRQEDAEEFLSCILNGLHEEMVCLTKATTTLNNGTCNGDLQTNGRVDVSEEDEEEDTWKVMGAKNKGMVTRSDQVSGSLIKDLFGGKTRSVLTAGSECSAVLQPFFTLQLETHGENVMESLSQLTVKEPIHGYQCPRSKKEVEACRRTTLEELPPVLILHFKRFVYDDKDGGSKKVLKRTDYPLDLELKTDLLSPEVKKKYSAKQSRSYKLFAVVYHDGKEAVKGHYVADIFYPGSGSWLHCDDRKIEPTTEAHVLAFNSPCVPYLLFYSRTDLQQQQQVTPASK